MSDRMYQLVTIGGDPGEHREKVMEMLEELESMDDEINEQSGGISISDCEASNDTFDDLKSFLREIGLSYDHVTEAKWEYDGTIQWWRPGMDEERWTHCTQSYDQTVVVSKLADMLGDGMTLAEALEKITIPPLPEWVQAAD